MVQTKVSGSEVTGVQANVLVKGAGIVSIVLAVVNPPTGLVVSIATLLWARAVNASTRLAVWGIIVAIIMGIVMVLVALWVLSILAAAATDGALDMEALCQHRDSWGWLIDSLRYVCR